jgi:cyanophycinase-like exopeptidase
MFHNMNKFRFLTTLLLLIRCSSLAQSYTSYFTGDTADVVTQPTPGFVLMGGSTENDSAMVWWLKKTNGGDVLVLRASGADGYNSYLFSELGISVNSVETIKFNSRAASFDPYVLRRLKECEAIWMAGGDQGVYTNYWKNSPVDSLINEAVKIRKVPIGGTSAGMAILGGVYFNALQGSITSAQALANPYNSLVSIGRNDFLDMPFLKRVITDTHFDNPDRRGRHLAFLARLYQDSGFAWNGICSEEKTAVCINELGIGRVFGNSPSTEFAYFTKISCLADSLPQVCAPGSPLTWKFAQGPVLVCKIPGTNGGSNTFDLRDWKTMTGGSWEYWKSNNGVFSSTPASYPDCTLSSEEIQIQQEVYSFPNPTNGKWRWYGMDGFQKIQLTDMMGRIYSIDSTSPEGEFDISGFPKGVYVAEPIEEQGSVYFRRVRILLQ